MTGFYLETNTMLIRLLQLVLLLTLLIMLLVLTIQSTLYVMTEPMLIGLPMFWLAELQDYAYIRNC